MVANKALTRSMVITSDMQVVGSIFLIGIFGYLIVHELSQIKDLLRQISELLTKAASASETCEKSLPSIENDIAAIKRKIEKQFPPSDW